MKWNLSPLCNNEIGVLSIIMHHTVKRIILTSMSGNLTPWISPFRNPSLSHNLLLWVGVCLSNLSGNMLAFHQHHKFDCHVDNIIEKMKSASHAIVRLKQFGVAPFAPALFYRTKVLSVLSYAAPLWYPHVTDKYKEKVSH